VIRGAGWVKLEVRAANALHHSFRLFWLQHPRQVHQMRRTSRRKPGGGSRRARDLAERLPRPRARHPARAARPARHEAPAGQCLPALPRSPQDDR